MPGHHDAPRPHPVAEWIEAAERSRAEDMTERSEPAIPVPVASALTWANLKELVGVVTIVLSCSGVYWGLKSDMQDERRIVEAIDARVALIEHGRAENLPRLEDTIRANAMQDQRIQNLTEALGSLRQTVVDLTRLVSTQSDLIHEAHERQAVMEERLGHAGPHDR